MIAQLLRTLRAVVAQSLRALKLVLLLVLE